ncbi:MAG: tetratricopeptide repeat protein [Bacteroidota bacterium]
MKNIILFLTINFSLLTLNSFAQNTKIDSLLTVLKTAKPDTNKVKTLNLISRNYWKIGSFDSSLVYANTADELSKKINYKKGSAESLINKGIINDLQGKYPEAIKEFTASLKLFEQLNIKLGAANALSNIGVIYAKQENNNEAEIYILKALKVFKSLNNTQQQIANSYNNLGNINLGRKNYDKAFEYFNLARNIFLEINYPYGEAKCLNNIGTIYKYQNNYTEAEKYYTKSLAVQQKIGDKNGMAITYDGLSIIYLKTNQLNKAKTILQKEMHLATEIGSMDEIKNSYYNQSVYDSLTGNYKNAFLNYRKFIAYKDSIINEENARKTMQTQLQYEFDKKFTTDSIANAKARELNEAEIATQKAELKAKRNQQIALYGGLALVGFFALFIYNRLKITNKQKTIIEQQKHLVDEKQKEILDSIHYAKRIQLAMLTSEEYISHHFNAEYFIFFQPKDVVSGDFYWATAQHNKFYIATADCTGHGVPGAFMSLLNISFLNENVIERGIQNPAEILNEQRKKIIKALNPKGNENSKDGMDCVLCAFDLQNNKLNFAAANNPVWVIRREIGDVRLETEKQSSQYSNLNSHILTEYKADKMPVGKYEEGAKDFTLQEIDLQKGDIIYTFTDGFADQFGGDKGKKFMYKKLKELLLENAHLAMTEQKDILQNTINTWKADHEQVDDILVIGVRV